MRDELPFRIPLIRVAAARPSSSRSVQRAARPKAAVRKGIAAFAVRAGSTCGARELPRRAAAADFAGDTSCLRVLPLDVTDEASIAALLETADPIDVLVNNAGIGAVGAFEATPMSLVRQLLETNTIGTMAMCQAVIPQMRARRSGIIVNVTSSVTLGAFPLAAAYTASKQAIEGFTGSLAHELAYSISR
ncbi:SDR family NAD(P)-dependent oxidoreductase [Sphingomonas sp.]|uniref:SDR family NAD(P)-dependent oxidoreductase n=1 Tax=Sphingomonas sp. TaxID=28214 RepID=UPI0025CFD533|nr:SDR family NAD(P)-dependent oxidoreductase [Sphingomonas sp.]